MYIINNITPESGIVRWISLVNPKLYNSLHLPRPSPSSNGFGSTAAATTPYASMGRLHPSTSTAANKSSGGGGDSDSDPPQQQPQHNRSRQKKFLKNFSQLPTATEEVVLQSE